MDTDSYIERRKKIMGNIIVFSDLEIPDQHQHKQEEEMKKVEAPPVTVLAEPLCITQLREFESNMEKVVISPKSVKLSPESIKSKSIKSDS